MYKIKTYKNHKGELVKSIEQWEEKAPLLTYFLIKKKFHGKYRNFKTGEKKYYYYGIEVNPDFKGKPDLDSTLEHFSNWMEFLSELEKDLRLPEHYIEIAQETL